MARRLRVGDCVKPSTHWLNEYHGEVRMALMRMRGEVLELEPRSELFHDKVLRDCARVDWGKDGVQDVRLVNLDLIWRGGRT